MVNVIEDEEEDVLVIDGRVIDGFIDDVVCPQCSERRIYFTDYDAFFCASCNLWLGSVCGDATCEYCTGRPEQPLPEG